MHKPSELQQHMHAAAVSHPLWVLLVSHCKVAVLDAGVLVHAVSGVIHHPHSGGLTGLQTQLLYTQTQCNIIRYKCDTYMYYCTVYNVLFLQ